MYVGDFPPCPHRFENSNGMVICIWCGQPPTRAQQGLPIFWPLR